MPACSSGKRPRAALLPDSKLPPVLPVVLFNGEPRWAAPRDLSTLVGLPKGSVLWRWQPRMRYHVVDEGAYREADLVRREGLLPLLFWCIPRRGGGEAYLVLLLEFQSRSDRWMALRMLVYVGMLWQQLIDEKRLLPDGRLPPVLPVVLFNGEPRWAAARDLRKLIGLPKGSVLWRWQPRMGYHVVDEGAYRETELARRTGLLPLLFRLENSEVVPEIRTG